MKCARRYHSARGDRHMVCLRLVSSTTTDDGSCLSAVEDFSGVRPDKRILEICH